jgi:hypothetical protein
VDFSYLCAVNLFVASSVLSLYRQSKKNACLLHLFQFLLLIHTKVKILDSKIKSEKNSPKTTAIQNRLCCAMMRYLLSQQANSGQTFYYVENL